MSSGQHDQLLTFLQVTLLGESYMNFKQLECFVRLSETLNFSETAKLIYMTQPAVTHLIRGLESELQLTLFIRDKRNVTLTPAGVSFYKDAKDILIKSNIAVIKAQKYSDEFYPTISLGYTGTFYELEYLPNIIELYHSIMPNVHLYLQKSDVITKIEKLLDHKLDILFTQYECIKDHPDIQFCSIINGQYACALPKDCALSYEARIKIEQLSNYTLVLLNPIHCTHDIAELQERILSSVPQSNIYYVDSPIDGYLMAKSNLGIAIMPDFVFTSNCNISVVPLDIPISLTYGAAYLKNDPRKEIRLFIKCINDFLLSSSGISRRDGAL
jgi:Transcriptional regulator